MITTRIKPKGVSRRCWKARCAEAPKILDGKQVEVQSCQRGCIRKEKKTQRRICKPGPGLQNRCAQPAKRCAHALIISAKKVIVLSIKMHFLHDRGGLD